MQKRISIRCKDCHGDNISGKAYCEWSNAKQQWVIAEWTDEDWCHDCNNEAEFYDVELLFHSELPEEVTS